MRKQFHASKITWSLIIAFLIVSITSFTSFVQLIPDSQATTSETQVTWMYMSITGVSQGDIQGDVTEEGKEGMIEVIGYHLQCNQPVDGRRTYSPLRITKSVDKASPFLMSAIINHELLDSVTLQFWRLNEFDGTPEHYYTIHLESAFVSSIESYGTTSTIPSETVSFIFSYIEWIDEINMVEISDDLYSQV